MISPEAAKKQLDAWHTESNDRVLSGAKKLPARLRAIALPILEFNPRGKPWEDKRFGEKIRAKSRAIAQLDGLPPKERLKLFGGLFGDLAPAVEAAWQLLKTSTYQVGYARKSFRAPSAPEATLVLREGWLTSMLWIAEHYRPGVVTPEWLAAWTPHLGFFVNPDNVGRLSAGVIDAGGPTADAVFDILCRSATGEHEIGTMGRHVSRALLMASRPEGWELIEKMLLAAQRQEGLRQVILETVDEAHPEAFRRMLRLVRDHDLARFSSVVRAANVWFGLAWDSVSAKTVNATIDRVLGYLDDPKARDKALGSGDPEAIFLALWSIAFDDALAAIPVAAKLLGDKRVEVRYVAALHLAQLHLPQTQSVRVAAIDDDDPRVALCALEGSWFTQGDRPEPFEGEEGLFERIERLIQRLPAKPVTLKPLVWPWTERKASREDVAWYLVQALGNRPPTAVIPYLSSFKPGHRALVVNMLSKQKKWDDLTRETLLGLAGDASGDVRGAAFAALAKSKLAAGENEVLEGYLTRKANDVRQGAIGLLLKQTDAQALASAERLLESKDAVQRLAGLEILRQLAEAGRDRAACRQRAAAYRAERKKLSRDEQTQIDAVAGAAAEQVTLDNALGLMNPADRSPAIPPKTRKVQFVTKAAVACLQSLDDLVHEHRETPVKYLQWGHEVVEELLGNVHYGFPQPKWGKPPEESIEGLPLAEIWEGWYAGRTKALRDTDGLELVRAAAWLDLTGNEWTWERPRAWSRISAERKKALAALTGGYSRLKLRYSGLVDAIVGWFAHLHPPAGTIDFLLDATETSFTLVPKTDMRKLADLPERKGVYFAEERDLDWRYAEAFELWCKALAVDARVRGETITAEQAARHWRLLRWRDEPFVGAARYRPDFSVLSAAYDHGAATAADVLDHLLGPDRRARYTSDNFDSLDGLTRRRLDGDDAAFLARHPEVREMVDRCRARIVEIELARGETPTAATAPAWRLRSLWGTDSLVQLLIALGKQGFKVPTGWRKAGKESKACTLTQLASVTYPKDGETAEDFRRLVGASVAEGHLDDKMILQLAFLAPQWAGHVESYLRWNGLSEALYWFLAHMQYTGTAAEQAAVGADVDEESDQTQQMDTDDKLPKPSAWERLIAERTPLSAADRQAGAVDVGWFRRVYDQVTPKRWLAMAEAARFAANAAQARHAQFVADVLTGKARRKDLIDGVRKRKLKDHVRLLGLYPLANGAKRQPDVIERYNVLQEYRRYARGLSAMTKPEALRAVEIGMQNLASTAGYADPLRLEWALEAEQVGALARGPVSAKKDGVTVTLALDADAQPVVTIDRAGKPLKSIPAAVKKDNRVAEIAEQAAHLKRQASRMKQSLEAAMCRGDTFSDAELVQLCDHPILAPLLGRLILAGEGIMGYPDRQGRALRDAAGKLEPVKQGEQLRVAHPSDLLAGGAWDRYQRECFQAERIQPFKQVFRELYVVTAQEKRDGAVSRRYAGQQIHPKQAYALWGQRGWSVWDTVSKTFHDAGVSVSVAFRAGGGTPLDVEGLTIEDVEFWRLDHNKTLALVDVPPRIFSEVMRDVDLVVSVAHRGGVDPEASVSTVEMRSSLLRETCALLGLANVRIKDSHVLVDGELGNYSVHLGSATVHRLPGGAVCLVAVPAQHRGRLFLPFADDDPRTAEVISKTILLARDAEIQDPTILEQLRA